MKPSPDVWRLISSIETQLRNAQRELTEMRAMLAASTLPLPPDGKAICPDCGQNCGNALQRYEHRQRWHALNEPAI